MIELKISILVDPMGSGGHTAEEEVEAHKRTFTALLDPAEIRFEHVWNPGAISPGTDLVVYDFGGLMPGTDLMESNAHAIVQWANDNTNSLLVVVSGFTYKQYIQYELDEFFSGGLFNVINDDGRIDDPIPQWFRDRFDLPKPDPDKMYDIAYPDGCQIATKQELDALMIEEADEPLRPEGPNGWESPEGRKYTSPGISVVETDICGIIPETITEIDNNDYSKEAPKEPVGFITVPVYCDWHPGVHRGSARFKIADCMVDVTDEATGKDIAHMGGAFYGFYECSFPDGKGSLTAYSIKPKDFWDQFQRFHTENKDKLQEMP